MSFASGLAIYFIIWWLVLFVTLPFGVRSQHEGEDMALGTDRGAPIKASIGKKAIATTLISLAVFGAFYYARVVVGFGLDDIPFLPTF
ncbi:DUF1467 family protein [Pararhizobium sp. IMCC21322]|uniref:DUF1467 family protein n=1 Tax=Pararhizobium sp. IMCC21322 TaxID=3067903 RepID=UPI0027409670|nr:DUF1467 family protein [Pararhizobium sp. IMCC21322]